MHGMQIGHQEEIKHLAQELASGLLWDSPLLASEQRLVSIFQKALRIQHRNSEIKKEIPDKKFSSAGDLSEGALPRRPDVQFCARSGG